MIGALLAGTALLGCAIWIIGALALAVLVGPAPTPGWLNAIGLVGIVSWGVFILGVLLASAGPKDSGWSEHPDGGE
jgi:hypothetical protein